MKEKSDLKVVHDNDLNALLIKIGVYNQVLAGEKKCKFCKSVITLESIHSVFPESGDINFICDKSECIKKLSEYISSKKYD